MSGLALTCTAAMAAGGQGGANPSFATSITAVGCISPAVHDGSLAGAPGVPPATPNTAPILANSAQPTGVYLLIGATPPDASDEDRRHAAAGHAPKEEGVTYELEGLPDDVTRHEGDLVEVTGTLTMRVRGPEAETRAPVHHLSLTNLKALDASCPTAPKR